MPERGDVWQVDFGITQKVRPALVISASYGESDRALIGVIPHKTLEVLDRINLGSRICALPVAANGTLYLATAGGWLWAVGQGK